MKKPRNVVRVENLGPTHRQLVNDLLDKGQPAKRIEQILRQEGIKSVSAEDVQTYGGWRVFFTERQGGCREGEAEEEAAGEPTGDEGARSHFMPDTLTNEIIGAEIETKAKRLVAESAADPSSDATKIVEALVLNQLKSAALKSTENDLKTIIELRRKGKETEQKYDVECLKRRHAEKELAVKTKLVEAKTKETDAKTEQIKAKTKALKRVAEVTDQVQQAQAQGRPWDPTEVVRKISAAIGMGQGLVERVEPQTQW